MNAKSLMLQHVKESAELKRSEKLQWNQLLKDQEQTILTSGKGEALAARFEKERQGHNEYFTKAKAEMIRKQEQDLQEFKLTRQQSKADEGRVR